MPKYIFFILFLPNWILAETWRCEISINNHGRGNINEQKIYTKHDNYYLKSSQFGDKKLNIFLDNDKQIIISKSSLNQSLWVFLNKKIILLSKNIWDELILKFQELKEYVLYFKDKI